MTKLIEMIDLYQILVKTVLNYQKLLYIIYIKLDLKDILFYLCSFSFFTTLITIY
jgi:hypothetical protein